MSNEIRYASYKDLSDEQSKVFKEALFKSKGKSNNYLGAALALVGADSDTIAKYASRGEGAKAFIRDNDYYSYDHRKIGPATRIFNQLLGTVPNFWDTVRGKNLKNNHADILEIMGVDCSKKLLTSVVNRKVCDEFQRRAVALEKADSSLSRVPYARNDKYEYSADTARLLFFADVLSPLAHVKFGGEYALKDLANSITEDARKKDFPNYDKYFDYDVQSLAHMDEEITKELEPKSLLVDTLVSEFFWDFERYAEASSTIESQCLIEGFYAVCEEIGIMGIVNKALGGRNYVSQTTLKGVMKAVIRFGGTYRRLVKSGFTESVARETVLAEINENIAKRASRPNLRFYPRNDYEDTREAEEERKKKTTTSSHSHREVREASSLEEIFGEGEEKEELCQQ